MELLIPTEKISLLLKISHTVSLTMGHLSSQDNYCSWFVLVLSVLPVEATTSAKWEQHWVRDCLLPMKTTDHFLCKSLQQKMQPVFAFFQSSPYFPFGTTYPCTNCHFFFLLSNLTGGIGVTEPSSKCSKEKFHFHLALTDWKAFSFLPKPLIHPMLPLS